MKKYIPINSILTGANLLILLFLRGYLSRKFSKTDLTIYFTLMDALTWLTLVVTGFKDALPRIFYHTNFKKAIIRHLIICALVVWTLLAVFVIPYLHVKYLPSRFPGYNQNFIIIEILFMLMIANLICEYLLLVNKIYSIISIIEFVKGFLFVTCFFFLFLSINLLSGTDYLIISILLVNLILFVWQIWYLHRYVLLISPLKEIFKKSKLDKKTTKDFNIYSILSTIEYTSAGIYIYISSFIILSMYDQKQLASFQVVARPLYTALIAIFSYPVFRFMFPEFSSILSKSELKKLKKIKRVFSKFCMIFGMLIIGAVWIFSKKAISIFFTPEYINAAYMLNVLIIGLPFVGYTSYCFALIKANGGFKYTLAICLLGAASFFSSLYLYAIWHDVFSVIYAMLTSVIIMFICGWRIESNLMSRLSYKQ